MLEKSIISVKGVGQRYADLFSKMALIQLKI